MKLRIAAALFTCVSLMMMSVAIFAATASAQDGYSSGTIDTPPSRPPGQPLTNPEDPDPTPMPETRPTAEPEAPVETPGGPGTPPPETPDTPVAPDTPDTPGSPESPSESPVAEPPQAESPAAPVASPTMPRPDASAPAVAPAAAPDPTTANGDTTGHLVTVDSGAESDDTDPASSGPIGYGFDRPVVPSTVVMGASDGFVGDPSAGSVTVTPSVSFDEEPEELAFTGPETPYIAYGGLALISAGMFALHLRRRLLGPAPKLEYR